MRYRSLRVKVAWPHPEWWSLGLAATAWTLILYRHYGLNVRESHHHAAVISIVPSFTMELLDWFLMVIATMLPVVMGSVRYTAGRSFWHRRHRAIGFFLTGYFSFWMLAGAGVSAAIAGLGVRVWNYRTVLVSGVFAAAALWQLTGFKQQALWSCHRTIPLAPQGLAADCDCMRYGWVVVGPCLVSCGLSMVACMLAEHNPVAMGLTGAISFAERRQLRPTHRVFAGAFIGFAIFQALRLFGQ